MKNSKTLGVKKKVWLFMSILILTIITTRILVYFWKDPNIFIGILELHHFYYGLILLVIVTLGMLFGKPHPKLYLILSAIAIGFILDESLFVMAKIRGEITYADTLFSATTLVFFVLIIIGIILFDVLGRVKKGRKSNRIKNKFLL